MFEGLIRKIRQCFFISLTLHFPLFAVLFPTFVYGMMFYRKLPVSAGIAVGVALTALRFFFLQKNLNNLKKFFKNNSMFLTQLFVYESITHKSNSNSIAFQNRRKIPPSYSVLYLSLTIDPHTLIYLYLLMESNFSLLLLLLLLLLLQDLSGQK